MRTSSRARSSRKISTPAQNEATSSLRATDALSCVRNSPTLAVKRCAASTLVLKKLRAPADIRCAAMSPTNPARSASLSQRRFRAMNPRVSAKSAEPVIRADANIASRSESTNSGASSGSEIATAGLEWLSCLAGTNVPSEVTEKSSANGPRENLAFWPANGRRRLRAQASFDRRWLRKRIAARSSIPTDPRSRI